MTLRNALTKLRRPLLWAGFAGALLVLLAAFGIDRVLGREVLLIAPHDPASVELNRVLYADGDPVAEIYGNPQSQPVRVVLPAEDRLIRPREDPSLLLMAVDKAAGHNPLQTRTVWFFSRFAVGGLILLGIAGLLIRK